MSKETASVDISPQTLKEWLDRGEVYLVDVRPPGMYEAEHIAQARPIPVARLTMAELGPHDGKKLVMQCQIGVASVRACHQLRAQGWQGELFNLAGGITAWKAVGLPTESDAREGGGARSCLSKLMGGRDDNR